MASDNILLALVRTTPNRGRTHIFLGHPHSDGCDKTTVEPGNTYSPGVWTCGISLWWNIDQTWLSPDLIPENNLNWQFIGTPGECPIISAQYSVGPLLIRHELTHVGGEGAQGVDFNRVTITGPANTVVPMVIVVKDIGPAGGVIKKMMWDEVNKNLVINKNLFLDVELLAVSAKIVIDDGKMDSPIGLLQIQLNTGDEGQCAVSFKTAHGFNERIFAEVIPVAHDYSALNVAAGFKKATTDWQIALPARVFAPDERVALTWERCAYHIQAAMEQGHPRIGAVNYPIFWMRDGVIVLRALDFMGRHDLAHIGNEYLAPLFFSGGFGAESDAPGEAIWALSSHARITKDSVWLREIFPTIKKRVDLIEKMRTTKVALRAMAENRIPFYQFTPGSSILCLPSRNGLIHGRMDFHSPDFFINSWSLGGLIEAVKAAQSLGEKELAELWTLQANSLEEAIATHLLPQYGNERSPIIAPYPSRALSHHMDGLRIKFIEWYRKRRLNSDNTRQPDLLWTYFEVAQAHNAFLLGFRDEAWVNIAGLIAPEKWDVAAYIEGIMKGSECLPYRNGEERRGWLNTENALGGNMPHKWTTAEMITLIRDMFVTEDKEGLVLGVGVPKSWIKPGAKFGVKNMPTDFGLVSYTVTIDANSQTKLEYEGSAQYRLALP